MDTLNDSCSPNLLYLQACFGPRVALISFTHGQKVHTVFRSGPEPPVQDDVQLVPQAICPTDFMKRVMLQVLKKLLKGVRTHSVIKITSHGVRVWQLVNNLGVRTQLQVHCRLISRAPSFETSTGTAAE